MGSSSQAIHYPVATTDAGNIDALNRVLADLCTISNPKEMAENALTYFNVHVSEFVNAIWVALRDPTLVVREKAIEALHACLRVIEKRETSWSVQWYNRMFEATQDGLGRNAPVHSIHGSLLKNGILLSVQDPPEKWDFTFCSGPS
ncbi:hypothetical protein CQW23_31717 [Capsicum baccatum]|uniref:Uncharacterized protein n=1 Tax=Capsicum baccatum TaxID=33114 RepID=A0A2G2V6N7_CAPBA|nr:hypothetical protein CQW23_31717 [Capsicum baccatum]